MRYFTKSQIMNRNFSFSGALLILVSLVFVIGVKGQQALTPRVEQMNKNFFEIQQEFNEHWAPYNVDSKGYYMEDSVRKKAGGWKQFKRWEWFWENRIDPVTGAFPKTSAADIYEELGLAHTESSQGSWTSLGPNSSGGGYAGIGRLNCLFEETISGDLYVGAASGGLWKSTNGGSTWSVLTDDNAVLGVSSVIVVPQPGDDIIYIGTGDRDGGSMWSLNGGQSNDNNSVGVLKSTDGGATWSATGLTYSASQKKTVNRLVIDPNDSDIIYAATSDGIYKTTDGGVTWPAVATGPNIIDLEMHPTNSSILYISTQTYSGSPSIYKTIDGGSSWTATAVFASTDYRVELAVTPANSNRVYAVVAKQDGGLSSIQRSDNAGDSFTQVHGSSPNMLGWYCDGSDAGGQGGYDLCIAADPSSAGTVYVGGVNTWKSTNGGSSWLNNNMWTSSGTYNPCGSPEVHADKHDLVFFGSTLYECNDGGLYKTTNGGNTWTDLTNGMVISQIYRLSAAQTTSNEVMHGLQDNGSKLYSSGSWIDVTGGDGMECLIDFSNVNTQYSTLPRGTIIRTTDHWSSAYYAYPGSAGTGAWVTPFVIDPNNNLRLIAGYEDIWHSNNQGSSWTRIGNLNISELTRSLAVAPSNSSYIYAAGQDELWRTTNGGSSWSDITGSLPVTSSYITYISVKDDDPNTVWVSMGEYNSHGVYQSTNGGTSWTNISSGLPNIPVMCVIQNKQNSSEVELYAGTDLGVYCKVGSGNWFAFNNGLPNVVVTELEIYYAGTPSNSLLRAATFGRGLWESDLYSASADPPAADFNADILNPETGQTVSFTDISTNLPTSWSWSFSPSTVTYVNSTSSSSQNPEVQFDAAGLYTVTLQATNAYGSDTEIKTDYIDAYDCLGISSFPYTQDFDSWTLSNPSYCTPDGSVLLVDCWANVTGDDYDWDVHSGATASANTGPSSDHTGGGNYLYIEASSCFSQTESITSPVFDLTGLSDADMTFWYHMWGADMGTLSVQVSTDGGTSWSSNIWSLSGDQGNSWQQQVINLDSYVSENDLVIRFTGATGADYASDIAIDDFSLTGTPISTNEDQVTAMDGGWNIMSFYVAPASLDMIDIFQPLIDDGSLVKISDEAGGFVQYIVSSWMNTIGDMENTEGYYVNLSSAGSLTTSGLPVTYPYGIPLVTGWNIMSYPCDVSQTAMTVLQPLVDDSELVKVISESGGVIEYITGFGWINTITNFVPGEGYYIN
ncbi:MAG: PKD domain-containing protein, partial [Bacteroidales bacterium]|nr:PKD domain-containing protein [Bacteroidales bacterium]